MAEMASVDGSDTKPPKKKMQNGHRPADRHGLLQHSREFLDFFWDIAKPQQETRLAATEKLLEYLRARPEGSEMKYALKRLIAGLGIGRETARPCFSLALAQLLQSFEDIPLCSILEQIQEKYNLQKVKKAMVRPALFANLFGVLSLFQSGRLVKDSEALMKSVQLLQTLAQHSNHLQEQPQKALVDILSEVPVATLKEILPKVLSGGLDSVLSSPEYLALFILARQKVPVRLKKLMGSVDLFSAENIPRLVDILKTAAASIKKEQRLPNVALDLLRLALREDTFPRFWEEVIEQGVMKKHFWPANYMCFRLLGTALPLLSKEQMQLMMRGDLIRVFGEHVVTSQVPGHFRFGPEMTKLVGTFLEGCQDDPERQLATVVAFTAVSNQGLPVIPTNWRAAAFLGAPALRGYVAWLRDMFLQPDLDSLVNFNTSHQEKNQDPSLQGPERRVLRLRKWIIFRLISIVDALHAVKEEALIEEVARFCFFHGFFESKKPVSQIPETKQQFSFPMATQTREAVSSAFFSLFQALSMQCRPTREEPQEKRPWPHLLVQFADLLLSHSPHVAALKPFTKQQRQTWNRMLQTLKNLEARTSDAAANVRAQARAFQHLLLLLGIHLFKTPEESCDLLSDVQTCIEKSLGEGEKEKAKAKARRTRSKSTASPEPSWVEVLVEILLTLLAQPSHLVRLVARSVFTHICSHLTPRALQLILDVLNPEKQDDEEEETVVVTDDAEEDLAEASEDSDSKGANSDSDEESGEESDEEDRDGDVDQGFREQLMAVLQAGKALGADSEDDDEDELSDEAMMALDQNLSSLFAEQKLRIQARRDEKNKLSKEKALRWSFQIRVLDLIEVLVTKQPENPLILELLKPLLDIIRCSMRASSSAQEKDFLHKTARIFSHSLFHARQYCRNLDNAEEMLHPRLAWLVQQAGRQADASISLYYFNASLYLLRVLRGNAAHKAQKETAEDPKAPSGLDLSFVAPLYSSALTNFLTRRNSPLTAPMFLSLFTRHPVLSKDLLPVIIRHLTGPLRPRQQGQACLLLQKALSMREIRLCFEDADWQQLIGQILAKVTENVRVLGQAENKVALQKELAFLELLNTLFRSIRQGKLPTDLTTVLGVLKGQQPALQQRELEAGSSRLHDLYWQAMKFLGVQRPKLEKKDAKEVPSDAQNPVSTKRKKKGFLPETKKRKKRKAEVTPENAKPAPPDGDQPPSTGKKKRKRRKKSKMNAQVPAQPPVNGIPATGSPGPAPPTESPSVPAKTPKRPKKKTEALSGEWSLCPSPHRPCQQTAAAAAKESAAEGIGQAATVSSATVSSATEKGKGISGQREPQSPSEGGQEEESAAEEGGQALSAGSAVSPRGHTSGLGARHLSTECGPGGA